MPSFHPYPWQKRFIESDEPRLHVEGVSDCGKREALLRAAAHRVDDPLYRALLIVHSAEAHQSIVQATNALYQTEKLLGRYEATFREWRFMSGAVIKIAIGVQSARGTGLYDFVGIEHTDQFGFFEQVRALRLLREGSGRKVTFRGTRRIDRDWRRIWPSRITFDGAPVIEPIHVSPDTAALEAIVLALTRHLHATHDGATWAEVVRARESVPPEHHEVELRELLQAIDTSENDRGRLIVALERARHRLAEIEGADPGACHRTCSPACLLRGECGE